MMNWNEQKEFAALPAETPKKPNDVVAAETLVDYD